MSDSQYYLSPNQQDLLVAALASNQPSRLNGASGENTNLKLSKDAEDNEAARKQNEDKHGTNDTSPQMTVMPGQFGTADDSPYLSFDLDAEGDDQFDFDSNGPLTGDLPGDLPQPDYSELHDKRKSVGDREDDDEGGGKRRESEGGTGKKPGRKPLTAEPTTVSCTFGSKRCLLTWHRSAKLKTELPNEPFVIARRNI
jgi:AP-1-like transcription factor